MNDKAQKYILLLLSEDYIQPRTEGLCSKKGLGKQTLNFRVCFLQEGWLYKTKFLSMQPILLFSSTSLHLCLFPCFSETKFYMEYFPIFLIPSSQPYSAKLHNNCTWIFFLNENAALTPTSHFPWAYNLCCWKITILTILICCDS